MNLNHYRRATRSTAIYPEAQTSSDLAVTYCLLGLANEAGEVAGKIKKALRDDDLAGTGRLTPQRREEVLAECGDVLWYLVRLTDETGTLLVVDDDHVGGGVGLTDLPSLGLQLAGVCSFEPSVPIALGVLASIARLLGSDLGQVAAANQSKLASRAQRGTLQGSGDDR